MEAVFLIFPLSYLAFNVFYGIFFMMLYYLIKEKRIVNKKEFLFILLFPSIGLGYWTYNRLCRISGLPDLPRRWHIWDKIREVHVAYITAFILFVCTTVFGFLDFLGFTGFSSRLMSSADFFTLPFIMLGIAFMFVVSCFVVAILALVLFLLPAHITRSIRANHYPNQQHSPSA